MPATILFLTNQEDEIELNKYFLENIDKSANHQVTGKFIDYSVSPTIVQELELATYDIVILPLSLPHYLSLRIAEVIHRQNFPTSLILRSETKCPERALVPPFDAFHSKIDSRELIESIATLLRSRPPRIEDQETLYKMFDDILQKAYCFTKSEDDQVPSTIEDYTALHRPISPSA